MQRPTRQTDHESRPSVESVETGRNRSKAQDQTARSPPGESDHRSADEHLGSQAPQGDGRPLSAWSNRARFTELAVDTRTEPQRFRPSRGAGGTEGRCPDEGTALGGGTVTAEMCRGNDARLAAVFDTT